MVSTREEALKLAARTRQELAGIYGPRLRGVYLFGSAARDELNQDSDIDIAIILDDIVDRFAEIQRTSDLGSKISLDAGILVTFLFIPEADYQQGKYTIYREVKGEGLAV